ncbi:hypothetical protein RRF57_009184 [Xylaria bambusicola]|uniref:Uncharacterized protein n=1 Tax=Xylaria bambusicola TaxID=326684 RepID=A0AAN7Z1D4_9PEZI
MAEFSHPFEDSSSQWAPVRLHNLTSRGTNSNKKLHLHPHRHRHKPRGNRTTTSYESSKSDKVQPHYTHPTAASIGRSFSASHKSHINPVATDPAYITRLWRNVMAYNTETQSSKGERRQGTRGKKALSITETTTSTVLTSVSRRELSWSTPSRKAPAAKVGDFDFQETVLASYGITIDREYLSNSMYDHLNLSELKLAEDRMGRWDHYQSTFKVNIWLKPEPERLVRIQEEYDAMKGFACNEAEYQFYALSEILLNQRRWPEMLDGDSKSLEPVRMVELGQKPSPNTIKWQAPLRIFDTAFGKQYEWDIRPDCAYYISLLAFEESLRPSVQKFVSVFQERALSPYLRVQKGLRARSQSSKSGCRCVFVSVI